MGCKPVQISLDERLLKKVDAHPQTKQHGRSAFVTQAIDLYLRAKKRTEDDERIARAYGGEEDAMEKEVEALLAGQTWPNE